jgi:deazaflavin-dependent oxidoreductase (nitroreductase family)
MGLGRWNFRQKPAGLFRRVLHAPDFLFKHGLGFLLGRRLLLITHRGRVSGRERRTTVEVVEHDVGAGLYVVCSGTGPNADWYLNLRAAPAVSITVGRQTWHPAQHFLDPLEAAARFARYERNHPRTARRLLRSMGRSYDGTDEGRVAMMRQIPMVSFSDRPAGGR